MCGALEFRAARPTTSPKVARCRPLSSLRRVLASLRKVAPVTGPGCPDRTMRGSNVTMSHSRTVPSLLALNSIRPSAESSSATTPSHVPAKVAISSPVPGSQIRTR